jgi:hypothetical protein
MPIDIRVEVKAEPYEVSVGDDLPLKFPDEAWAEHIGVLPRLKRLLRVLTRVIVQLVLMVIVKVRQGDSGAGKAILILKKLPWLVCAVL